MNIELVLESLKGKQNWKRVVQKKKQMQLIRHMIKKKKPEWQLGMQQIKIKNLQTKMVKKK